jgi:hypothetical protein
VGYTRIDADNMRRLSGCEFVETFSSFGVPELHISVIAGRNELRSTRVEVDVIDRFGMPGKCSQELPLMVYVPKGDLRIRRC